MNTPVRAVVLFAHGSRDPLWSRPIEAIAARMREYQPGLPVRCAYLELMAPDLAAVVQDLARSGVQSITIMPMFLGLGRHARDDLPELLRSLTVSHPGIHIDLRPAIGEHPQVLELLARLALEA